MQVRERWKVAHVNDYFILAEHCYPCKRIILLYAFVSNKSERDKYYKVHSDDSQCLVIDSVLVAKPSDRVELNLTRGLGACKNVGPATKNHSPTDSARYPS